MKAAKVVKMCDMSAHIAAKVFYELNRGRIAVAISKYGDEVIVTDVEPKDLVYPEGWYYAKGYFRNKHMSTTGAYYELRMETTKGAHWAERAKYCTLYDSIF